MPMALRPSNDRNLLGSHIDKSTDKASEKFRNAHVITSYKKPLFIDIAIRELVERCGVNKVSEAAARLLKEADSKEQLGRIRKKRHGTKGMSKDSPGTTGPGRSLLRLCTSSTQMAIPTRHRR